MKMKVSERKENVLFLTSHREGFIYIFPVWGGRICLYYQSMIIDGEGEIFTKCKSEELSEQKQSP